MAYVLYFFSLHFGILGFRCDWRGFVVKYSWMVHCWEISQLFIPCCSVSGKEYIFNPRYMEKLGAAGNFGYSVLFWLFGILSVKVLLILKLGVCHCIMIHEIVVDLNVRWIYIGFIVMCIFFKKKFTTVLWGFNRTIEVCTVVSRPFVQMDVWMWSNAFRLEDYEGLLNCSMYQLAPSEHFSRTQPVMETFIACRNCTVAIWRYEPWLVACYVAE